MTELLVFAVLALHGLCCTVALGLFLWRAARWRDRQLASAPPAAVVPEKLEPPYEPARGPQPAAEIFPIMAEHFPVEYARYRRGELGYPERRWVWEACCAVRDARVEIEELCS